MTRWLDAQQQQDWRALLTGTSMLFEALNRDLEERAGISVSEYEVFVRLSEAPNRTLRMSVLADRLVHSRSRITHMVRRLEERGLVSRCAASGDGRGVECRLTDAGMEALVAAAPAHVDSVRARLVDVVPPDQLRAMGAGFRAVAAAIARDTGAPIAPPLGAEVCDTA